MKAVVFLSLGVVFAVAMVQARGFPDPKPPVPGFKARDALVRHYCLFFLSLLLNFFVSDLSLHPSVRPLLLSICSPRQVRSGLKTC